MTLKSVEQQVRLQRTKYQEPKNLFSITGCYENPDLCELYLMARIEILFACAK
jgi:hypothetical protein